MMPLFSDSREEAAHYSKIVCALFAAETAGYLLTQFHHAQITFDQIVVEGNRKLMQKAQHTVLVCFQAKD